MRLNLESLKVESSAWEKVGVKLPLFDIGAMRKESAAAPEWVHFGGGNIFRGFIASLAQRLLNAGKMQTGIHVLETFDGEVIDKIYDAFDNLTLNVTLKADGTTEREILASVASARKAEMANEKTAADLKAIFCAPSLKMVSFTITEKGYQLHRPDGTLLGSAAADMEKGPGACVHAMGILCSLLLARFAAGALPVAIVSMDNCSHNGEKLMAAVLEIADAWIAKGFASAAFRDYLTDEKRVAFPWTMIDKITPRPHEKVRETLVADGIEGMETVVTEKKTYIAGFVNAEASQYLVVEDKFPNGRPSLEEAGVLFTTRETVEKVEKMKVTTCLNPLHTAMSMYGCLLGYTLICEEMKDADIVKLVKRLGYVEGLPVVVDPKVISPRAFLDEVVNERLPNPFMPDDPRRIATDTSQKVGVRFGETIKSYVARGMDMSELVVVPMALAGWMRYLLAVNDAGEAMEVSADPLKDEMQAALKGIVWNDPASYKGQLRGILSNARVFGLDLTTTPLAGRIEKYFVQMLSGAGAVRKFLHEELAAHE